MSKERILLVEDERIIAIDLKWRLEKFGYKVVAQVATGVEAIEKAHEEKPDIILMDILLTGEIDGIEAAEQIKDSLQIPVIFLTAYSDEKTLGRAKVAEPFGYILKPFKEKELYTTIDIALYKHKVDNKLKQQRRWLSAVLHSIGDGIIATDMNNTIQFMNPIAEAITGWTEDEAKDKTLQEIINISKTNSREIIYIPAPTDPNATSAPLIIEEAEIKNRLRERIHIEGTVTQIRDRKGSIEGQVLAIRDTTEIKQMSEKISYQASHDTLTGLRNRKQFSRRLAVLIRSVQDNDREHSLLYLGLDRFKIINDTCGHVAGDQLLIQVTNIIESVVRSSDTCARLGGDEFGILLEGADSKTALTISKRLHKRITGHKLIWEQNIFDIRCSIGLVMVDRNSKDLHTVLAAADDACYIAKDEGGNRIKIYDTTESLFMQRRGEMQWISRISKALEENRFILFGQPILPLRDEPGFSPKLEVLLRMIDEENKMIPPAEFIPAAERYNMMAAIDRWVIRNALEAYSKAFNDSRGKDPQVILTINLSASSLAEERFLDYITSQFTEIDVPPSAFCFEITETAAISNMGSATRFIAELKQIGCTFALDDFGNGFSSFNYLKNLQVDYLKIDGSFVQDMDQSRINRAMVEAINDLGHAIKVKTIAEFVTNKAVLNDLKAIGVDYGQGYELGKPSPLLKQLSD